MLGSVTTPVLASGSAKSANNGNVDFTSAGLKRKQLHTEKGDTTPALQKKPRTEINVPYDPPNYATNDFVTNQSADLQCVRCKRVPRKPLRSKCCNTLHCEPCSSPGLCTVHGQGAEYKPDAILRSKISKLTVHCPNSCGSKCAVYQMRDHLSICKGKKLLVNQPTVALATGGSAGDVVEPMDMADGKTSQSTLSSDSQKGAANIALLGSDLKRQPLQPGVVTAETSNTVNVPHLPPKPHLPPLAEVIPAKKASVGSQPTVAQLQDTLNKVIAIVNANKNASPGGKQPAATVSTLKVPGGKEVQIDIKPPQPKQSAPPLTQVSTSSVKQSVLGTSAATVSNVNIQQGVAPQGACVSPIVTTLKHRVGAASQSKPETKRQRLLVNMPPDPGTSAPVLLVTTPSAPVLSAMTHSVSPKLSVAIPSAPGVTVAMSAPKPVSSSGPAIVGTKKQNVDLLKLGDAFSLHPSVTNHGKMVKSSKGDGGTHVSAQKKTPQMLKVVKLTEIEIELKPVATKWRKLGQGLGQNASTLKEIATANSNNPDKCLSAVLSKWNENVQSGSQVSWKTLCKALSKDSMGEKVLADSLMEKYGTNVRIDYQQQHAVQAKSAAKLTESSGTTVTSSSVVSPPTSVTPSSRIVTPTQVQHTSLPITATPTRSVVPPTSSNTGQFDLLSVLSSSNTLQNISSVLTNQAIMQKLVEATRKSISVTNLSAPSKDQDQRGKAKEVGSPKPSSATAVPTVTLSVKPPSIPNKPTLPDGNKAAAKPAVTVATVVNTIPPTTDATTAALVPASKLSTTQPETSLRGSMATSLTKTLRSKSPQLRAVEISKVKLNGATTVTALPKSLSAPGNSVAKPGQKHKPGVGVPVTKLTVLSDEVFTTRPKKEIHCSKCQGVPLTPKRPKCNCNVVYCEACVNALAVCPLCNKNEGYVVDASMRRRIWNLQVPCMYKLRGCDWRGSLSKLDEHDKECCKRNLPCKYKALGCEELMAPVDVNTHDEVHKDKHMKLALEMVVKLIDRVKTLEGEVAELKK